MVRYAQARPVTSPAGEATYNSLSGVLGRVAHCAIRPNDSRASVLPQGDTSFTWDWLPRPKSFNRAPSARPRWDTRPEKHNNDMGTPGVPPTRKPLAGLNSVSPPVGTTFFKNLREVSASRFLLGTHRGRIKRHFTVSLSAIPPSRTRCRLTPFAPRARALKNLGVVTEPG